MNFIKKISLYTVIRIIAIILLFAAIFDQPYWYYVALKFIIFCITGYGAYIVYEKKLNQRWLWIFVVIALLFNPFIPVHLDSHELWSILNVVVAIILLVSIFKLEGRQKSDTGINTNEQDIKRFTWPKKETIKKVSIIGLAVFVIGSIIGGIIYYQVNQDFRSWIIVKQAESKIERAKENVKNKPMDSNAHLNLGIAYYNYYISYPYADGDANFLNKASLEFNTAINLDNKNATVYRERAKLNMSEVALLGRFGDVDEFIANNITKKLSPSGRFGDAHEWKSIYKDLSTALKLQPQDSEAHRLLGRYYDTLWVCLPSEELGERYQSIEKEYKLAIQYNKNNYAAYIDLALYYLENNDKNEALKVYEQLKQVNKSEADKLFKKIYQ